MMSTNAPAGIAKRNIGSVFATWTIETVSGLASRLTISHPVATLYIQEPILDTTVASQIIANVRCVNGAQAGTPFVRVGKCCDLRGPGRLEFIFTALLEMKLR